VTIQPNQILELIWIVWLVSWVLASFWSARTKAQVGSAEAWMYRAPQIVGGILLVPYTGTMLGEPQIWHVGYGGAVVLALVMVAGLAFTWWARIYLGRLWSSAITRKEDHTVVDSGPYAVVRHPIYTGIIIALVATAAVEGRLSAVVGAALIIVSFWLKARSEERFLAAELSADAYSAYRRRVPMLVPFLPQR
jgi:protein-S-isoprenylcysteine O-methyltransferase Ste14